MRDDPAGAIGPGIGLDRHKQRARALGEQGVEKGHAHLEAEAFDDRCGLGGAKIEIEQHARRAAAFHGLEQTQHGISCWMSFLPRDLAAGG